MRNGRHTLAPAHRAETPASYGVGRRFQHLIGVTLATTKLVFEGRCWKFGDHIPTDMITPTHIMFKTAKEMAAFEIGRAHV